jgi:Na+-translocating ferredoxin:NAD+ oxidoreductase RnfD subunit
MIGSTATVAPPLSSLRRILVAVDNRYLAPVLVTGVLLVGHLSFGILESYTRTALAIVSAIVMEIVLGRMVYGRWPHLASAYITGISVGMLVRTPVAWPFVLGSVLSIASKYVLRVRGRHLWNPSNFGLCALLILAPATVTVLSIQWGNQVWPLIEIWVLGGVILWRLERLHLCAAYVGSFLLLAGVRSAITGVPWLATIAPITGPMYQLFIFFMITDPRTTVRRRRGQYAVVVLIALVETVLRLRNVVYAPLYALFVVGPPALLFELWRDAKPQPTGRPSVAA